MPILGKTPGATVMKKQIPPHYAGVKQRYPLYLEAVEALGRTAREAGPLEAVTAHLVQLGGAVAVRSEGAVHSHVRRALDEGATPEQVEHAIILLTSTVGFPAVMAALSWARDVYG